MRLQLKEGFLSWYASFALLGCAAAGAVCFQIAGLATKVLSSEYRRYLLRPQSFAITPCAQLAGRYTYACGSVSGVITAPPFSYTTTSCMGQTLYAVE